MSPAARSMFVFSLYMFFVGLVLLIAPNLLLGIFGFPLAQDVWIRVVGLLAFLLGFYYLQAARAELRIFFTWTIPTRICVFVVFLAFVLMRMAAPALVIFGLVDLCAALWTAWALRANAPSVATAHSRS